MKKLLIGLFCVAISGCASTEMTSFVDPAYRNTTFQKLLIVARTNNLTQRLWLESHLAQAFTIQKVDAKESVLLLPPTRKFSEEQRRDTMVKYGYDAYLVVDVGETGVESIYIPPTQAVTKTSHNAAADRWTSVTTLLGGGTIEKPWAQVRTTLCDASTNEVAWIADSYTGGSGYSSFNTVINSYCREVFDRLLTANLVFSPRHSNDILTVKYILRHDAKFLGGPAAKHADSDRLALGWTKILLCPSSPIGNCIYDEAEDPGHKHCIFCGLAEDR